MKRVDKKSTKDEISFSAGKMYYEQDIVLLYYCWAKYGSSSDQFCKVLHGLFDLLPSEIKSKTFGEATQ